MVRKDINKNLKKQIVKSLPDITGAELDEISKVVAKETLRRKAESIKKAKRKPDCGCDN